MFILTWGETGSKIVTDFNKIYFCKYSINDIVAIYLVSNLEHLDICSRAIVFRFGFKFFRFRLRHLYKDYSYVCKVYRFAFIRDFIPENISNHYSCNPF